MNKNCDLELNILSCLLQKPDLMKEHKLKDEYFTKYDYFIKSKDILPCIIFFALHTILIIYSFFS